MLSTTCEFKRRLNVASQGGETTWLAEQQNLVKAAQATAVKIEEKDREGRKLLRWKDLTAGYHLGLWFND